ncbi:MAG TPA: cytochrome P450 [Acidobacteriaceae bacterium]
MPIPFQPSLPDAPCFDAARNAWILSRYVDVAAALRESSLCQATAANLPTTPDENAQHSRLAADVQADVARMSTEEWRTQMDETLSTLLEEAKARNCVDLVREIIHPWATTMLITLNGGRSFHSRRLAQISERLFYGPAGDEEPLQHDDDEVERRRNASEDELNRMLDDRQLMLSKSTFFGLTQTLPSFLAKAWLALLQHPGQMEKLIDNPKLMGSATEELQRYAGVVHTLYRRAARDVQVGAIDVRDGQMVALEMDSANFDPERFENPYEMDVTRKVAGHLGLGTGLHACVGSFLVRMACSVATPVLLAARPLLLREREVLWTGDRTMLWPLSIPVRFAAEEARAAS